VERPRRRRTIAVSARRELLATVAGRGGLLRRGFRKRLGNGLWSRRRDIFRGFWRGRFDRFRRRRKFRPRLRSGSSGFRSVTDSGPDLCRRGGCVRDRIPRARFRLGARAKLRLPRLDSLDRAHRFRLRQPDVGAERRRLGRSQQSRQHAQAKQGDEDDRRDSRDPAPPDPHASHPRIKELAIVVSPPAGGTSRAKRGNWVGAQPCSARTFSMSAN
jgi:hypothetical protein